MIKILLYVPIHIRTQENSSLYRDIISPSRAYFRSFQPSHRISASFIFFYGSNVVVVSWSFSHARVVTGSVPVFASMGVSNFLPKIERPGTSSMLQGERTIRASERASEWVSMIDAVCRSRLTSNISSRASRSRILTPPKTTTTTTTTLSVLHTRLHLARLSYPAT